VLGLLGFRVKEFARRLDWFPASQ